MSQMIIKVVAVEVGNGVTKTGKDYKFLDVMFKNVSFDNKAESKKIMPFGSKEVYATLESAKAGDTFTILREKDKDGFWQWIGIAEGQVTLETTMPATNNKPAAAAATTAAPKSSFETAEERAKRQSLIVRQSATATAVAYLNHNKKNYTLQDILDTADVLYNYTFQTDVKVPTAALPDLGEDKDIPY